MDAETFLQTLRSDVLDSTEYADAAWLNSELAGLMPVLKLIEEQPGNPQVFFGSTAGRRVASLLFGVKPAELVEPSNRLVLEPLLRQWPAWLKGEPLPAVVRGILLAEAHSTRRDRRRSKFEALVSSALSKGVASLQREGLRLSTRRTSLEFRAFDFVVFDRREPVIAVIDVFQIGSGGRQSAVVRDMPTIQASLARQNIALLIVADGPGFAAVPNLVREVLPQLRFITNLSGVEQGQLPQLLADALGVRDRLAAVNAKNNEDRLSAIAKEALSRGQPVTQAVLGADKAETEAYLLRFRAMNPEYALVVAAGHGIAPEAASELQDLRQNFAVARAGGALSTARLVTALGERLGVSIDLVDRSPAGETYHLVGLNLPLRLPSPLPLFIPSRSSSLEPKSLEQLEKSLANLNIPGRVIVILDPYKPQESREMARKLGLSRRVQFAVLDEADLIQILLRNYEGARDELRRFILRRADLSLVSPFISEGPTSHEMFFGREAELRRIAEQIREHSFALVGGRKVGKTSLLQKLASTLMDTHEVAYVDCQAHPDREDFLRHIQAISGDGTSAAQNPLAPHAERILGSYLDSQFKSSFGVLLVDEVDDLFLADAEATLYPHVLSRALRALSQSHRMSLVATGERGLFALTRDPSSPHWNFCTPLRIGPLETNAAQSLLEVPFRALGIHADPEAVEAALNYTVRHPNLLQHLGSEVVESLASASRSGQPLAISSKRISEICFTPEFRDRFVRTFWSQAGPLERLLSSELRHDIVKDPGELKKSLGNAQSRVKISDVIDGLSYLELYGIARRTEEGFVLAQPVFEQYLQLVPKSLLEQWQSELIGSGA